MTHGYVFKRSIQIDPNFAYAYTLSGHEYVANDDLDKALLSFRTAIRVDSRHYNAWYVSFKFPFFQRVNYILLGTELGLSISGKRNTISHSSISKSR